MGSESTPPTLHLSPRGERAACPACRVRGIFLGCHLHMPLTPPLSPQSGERGAGCARGARRPSLSSAVGLICLLFILAAAAFWIVSLGAPPIGEGLEFSTLVVDREGPPVAALCDAGGPLACRRRWKMSIRAFSSCCSPTRTSGSVAIPGSMRRRSHGPRFSSCATAGSCRAAPRSPCRSRASWSRAQAAA